MSNAAPQVIHRRTLAIKRLDAEPLTREDVQYDLLYHIFDDQRLVFTDPHTTLSGEPPGTKVSFRDLYVNALVKSPRSSKVLREKATDTPQFGTDFAKVSLLANVGRINTTMAFFPEMRTSLRTYHPVPSLEKSDGNLQDAPRIKNILKACLLENEARGPPLTPMDILLKRDSGQVPSTSVVNLIFVMANHSVPIARAHFEPSVDFLDIFLPVDISSKSRARAFLWLCYHYLEAYNLINPFADEHARRSMGKVPLLVRLTPEEAKQENVDTPDEKAKGEKMADARRKFLTKNHQEMKAAHADNADRATVKKEKEPTVLIQDKDIKGQDSALHEPETEYIPRKTARAKEHSKSSQKHAIDTFSHGSSEPYPRRQRDHVAAPSTGRVKSVRSRQTKPRHPYHDVAQISPERTMLQHAWHIVTTTDPLIDSDEENADEHVRLDYMRRLQTLNRLRGKSPTPEAEENASTAQSMEVDRLENHWTQPF